MSDTDFTILFLVVMLVGLAGTLLPILPGIVLMWGATIAYGFAVGFGGVAIPVIIIASLLTIIALASGFVLPKRAAEEAGASNRSQWFAAIGAIIGFFVIPIVGAIIGAVAGIALSEYQRTGDWAATRRSTIGIAKGFGLSALAQFSLGFLMLVVWLAWAATVAF